MNIYSSKQLHEWDQYTIQFEPISSIDLMERAAQMCSQWIQIQLDTTLPFLFFCGPGNNGGDGLAIARQLALRGMNVKVCLLTRENLSKECSINLHKWESIHGPAVNVDDDLLSADLNSPVIIVDALFGSGQNRTLEGLPARSVNWINQQKQTVISIDLPSGVSADQSVIPPAVRATHTLTFQAPKLSCYLADTAIYWGQITVLDIGLSSYFSSVTRARYETIDPLIIKNLIHLRSAFAHKGDYGHAAILAGSYGMIGAAVLASRGCLRSGAGKVTVHSPRCGYNILQSSVPEAMVRSDLHTDFLTDAGFLETQKYQAIGIGPGIGKAIETEHFLESVIYNTHCPMVIDADGLNILARRADLLQRLPEETILTPHPGEFERLFGTCVNDSAMWEMALNKAEKHKIIVVLKGHHTLVATPGAHAWINTTGNAGMATGGTGDVLTGVITGLLAQGYPQVTAAVMGVYLHGLAGDIAQAEMGEYGMIAGDVAERLPHAFHRFLS
jgi:ADP-dependent NAD(P)H-hydrate dehydratase / NAD(P)H-hydrate epimerase